MEAPTIIKMEQEIDREMMIDAGESQRAARRAVRLLVFGSKDVELNSECACSLQKFKKPT